MGQAEISLNLKDLIADFKQCFPGVVLASEAKSHKPPPDVPLVLVGVTQALTAHTFQFYSQWLDRGYQCDMDYLKRHAEQKKSLVQLLPGAQSAMVFALAYQPAHPYPTVENSPLKCSDRIAAYAQGRDYHVDFLAQLDQLVQLLSSQHPQAQFYTATDSRPVLERDLAHRAGLGWIGKNTCLINQYFGSWFLIGEIITTLKIESRDQIATDHCGNCRRCLDACPTEAFEEPHVLNPAKCISYWTIEARSIPPPTLRPHLSNWLFGCDICQSVCPWNRKADTQPETTSSDREHLLSDLKFILENSNSQLRAQLAGTPLERAAGTKLKRTALIMATQHELWELAEVIEAFKDHDELKDLARDFFVS